MKDNFQHFGRCSLSASALSFKAKRTPSSLLSHWTMSLPLNLVAVPTLQGTGFDPWGIIKVKLSENNLHYGSFYGTQFKWTEVSKFIITIHLRKGLKRQFIFAVRVP